MIRRHPDHPDWYEGGLYHDNEDFTVPALWVNSWFDLSVGPNLALYEHVRTQSSDAHIRDAQYMIVAPTEHCHMYRLREPHVVGDRDMGSVNTLAGDGRLVERLPPEADEDSFRYDPLNPVPSLGGNVCCLDDAVKPGSVDQRPIEARADVLVYTSAPLAEDLEVSGPVEVLLHVSSDARDTDFTAKLLDVAPDGSAWNLDESIQRARYREGYDREVFLEDDEVVELRLGPLVTSNVFKAGHHIRVEISSSSFPRFARNLNTGGDIATEIEPVVANNAVHHGPRHPSRIVLTTVPTKEAP